MKYKKFYIAATLFASLLLVTIVFLKKKNEDVEMSPSFFNAIRYIDSNSHETVTYLEALAADTIKMNKAEKMLYDMYLTYALDKKGIGKISLKETERFVEYYSKRDIDSLRLFAMYLHAGAYRDIKDYPNAVECYLKAIDFGKEKKLYSNRFFHRSFDQLAHCYNCTFLGKKSIAVLKEAEKYINNSYITRIHFRMGQEYNNIGCYDSARFFFLKCLAESPKQQFNDNAADCIDLFLQQKDTLYIYKYKDALLAINEDKLAPQYAVDYVYSKSLYYDFVQNTDSAIYYSKKILDYNVNSLASCSAAECLMRQYRKQNNISEAFKYADLYCQLSDSVMRNTESERVSQVGNMYNYQVEQKKANDALRKSNAHLKLALWIIAILVAVVGLVIAVIRLLKKRFNTELADSQHHIHLVKQENEALDKNLETIQREKASLETENKTLNEKLKVSEELQKQTTEEVANLNQCLERVQKECELAMQKNEQLAMQYAEEKSVEKALADLERLKQRLSVQSSATFTADTWAEVHTTVDVVYPQLHVKLAQHFPQLDLVYTQLLYLSCMSLTLTCVANLLTVYPQALVKRKKRLVDWITKENPRLQINNFEQLLIYLKKEA